jgi:hypothetical protein
MPFSAGSSTDRSCTVRKLPHEDSADGESGHSLRRFGDDLDRVDSCTRRPFATPLDHAVNGCVVTLESNLHSTVGEVACRAEHPDEDRLAAYAISEVDTLHPAGNKQSAADYLSHVESLRSTPTMSVDVGQGASRGSLPGTHRAKSAEDDVDVNQAVTMALCFGDVEGLFAGW